MIAPITDFAQYSRVLIYRELIAAPLREARTLPPYVVPAKERETLRALLAELDESIARYKHDRELEYDRARDLDIKLGAQR